MERNIRLTEHVSHIGERRNNILDEGDLETPDYKAVDNIKMDLDLSGYGDEFVSLVIL